MLVLLQQLPLCPEQHTHFMVQVSKRVLPQSRVGAQLSAVHANITVSPGCFSASTAHGSADFTENVYYSNLCSNVARELPYISGDVYTEKIPTVEVYTLRSLWFTHGSLQSEALWINPETAVHFYP